MQTFIESALKPDQAKALRSLSIWIAVAPTAPTAPDMVASESTDTTTTWKSWSPSPKIVDEGLMQGIQELQLAISVFDSEAADANWRDMKEVEGILRLKDLTSFKRVSVAVSQDEEGGAGSNREVVNMYAEEVKERLLGVYVPRPVVVEEE
jgi:hypothetical protein